MCLKIALYSLYQKPGFYLFFILSENKRFQSGTLLIIPTSSPSMEEFCLKKMQVSKATSSIWKLLASLDIHYNNILNTEVQK